MDLKKGLLPAALISLVLLPIIRTLPVLAQATYRKEIQQLYHISHSGCNGNWCAKHFR